MKRFTLVLINSAEDPEVARRKSTRRRRRLENGWPIDSSQSSPQTQRWWQRQGRYDHEVEVVYGPDGQYQTQYYTGCSRAAG
ncbi:MAG: hypothetical protein HUU49_04120 [Candidatus Buchananbacteria bacterium]|nr:hypothetical protein [Candidatus Buchananbacteria bacterium]